MTLPSLDLATTRTLNTTVGVNSGALDLSGGASLNLGNTGAPPSGVSVSNSTVYALVAVVAVLGIVGAVVAIKRR